jgi:HAD superfamily hydrolase (TIGR01509 family)
MQLQAVIFDADGTLVDSEVPGLAVVQSLSAERGLVLSDQEMHERFQGVPMTEVVQWIAERLGQPSTDFCTDFTRHIRAAMQVRFELGLQPMPGANAVLAQLSVPFAVATNGPREKVEQTLRVCGLRAYFGRHVYCAYELGSFKPAPGLFLHVAQALGVEASRCAVVEDSWTGVQAGLAAGMQVYALCPPTAVPVSHREQVQYIDRLDQLLEHLPATALKPLPA